MNAKTQAQYQNIDGNDWRNSKTLVRERSCRRQTLHPERWSIPTQRQSGVF